MEKLDTECPKCYLRALILALVFASLIGVSSIGCGSGSSTESVGSTAAEDPSAAFINKKSPNNKYATYGSEAPNSVREAASVVLGKNLKAREEGDFVTQCATLAKKQVQQVAEDITSRAARRCPAGLEREAKPLAKSRSIRADHLMGPIAALRTNGKTAFALFHGNDKIDYGIPMRNEAGHWKVASIITIELGKS